MLLLFRSRCYLALCAAFAAFCAMQWIFFAWFPTFLQERFGLSMTESGWNGTVFIQTSAITGILAGGAFADRLRRRWPAARLHVAATGVLLSAPFAYLTFSATSLNQARAFSAHSDCLADCWRPTPSPPRTTCLMVTVEGLPAEY